MPLLVFGHIDSRNQVLIVEQEFGKCLCQFGLADTGRTHEEERTYRPLLILQSSTASPHCIRNGFDCLILPYNPLMKFVFHAEKFFLFAFKHPFDRYPRPLGHDFGYIFRSNRLIDKRMLVSGDFSAYFVYAPLGFSHLAVTYFCDLPVITAPFRRCGRNLEVFHVLAFLLKFGQSGFFFLPLFHQDIPFGRSSLDCILYLFYFQ